jgi:hypothetical protein
LEPSKVEKLFDDVRAEKLAIPAQIP